MAAVAHWTAVVTSFPVDNALNAPWAGAGGTFATGSWPPTTGGVGVGAGCGAGAGWAAGCEVVCGTCSLGENQVGVPGSAARGTRGAQAGTLIAEGGFVRGC